jgi:hypothetical protein
MRETRTGRGVYRSLLADGEPPGPRTSKSPERELVRGASWMPRSSSMPSFWLERSPPRQSKRA